MPANLFECGRHRKAPALVLGRIDLQEKLQAQRVQTRTKLGVIPVGRVAQHGRWSHPVGQRLPHQLERDHGFRGKLDCRRYAGARAPRPIFRPAFWQVKPATDGGGEPAVSHHHLNADLAIGLLADRSAVLMRDTDRVLALLQPASLIDHPRFHWLQMRDDLLANFLPDRLVTPRAGTDKLLQILRLPPQPRSHGLDGFTLAGHEQPLHVARRRHPPFTPAKPRHRWRQKAEQMFRAALKKRTGPFHASSWKEWREIAIFYLTE